jgi:hypothetical protein
MAVDGARVLTRRVTGRGRSAASPAATVAAGRRSISVRLADPHRARGCPARRALQIWALRIYMRAPLRNGLAPFV